MTVEIAEAISQAHVAEWVEVCNACARYPQTVEGRMFWRSRFPATVDLVARRDGRAVGAAYVQASVGTERDDLLEAGAWVLPAFRRQGLGRALHRAASARARALGALVIETETDLHDPAGLAYLLAHGYEEVERSTDAVLELTDAAVPEQVVPQGIVLELLSERPDALAGMYEVACEATPDIPGAEKRAAGSFDEWRAMDIDRPGRPAELCVVAFAGSEVVGYGTLGRETAEMASHGLTGVRRAWRGKGIARAIKVAQIRLAKEHGFARLVTENELRNAPIRHLNDALGYRPVPGSAVLRGPLLD